MTVADTIRQAESLLEERCSRPRYEAELLLAYHMQKDRLYLHSHDKDTVEGEESYFALISRRAAHEPYAYIVGEASFYDLHLSVARGVLIPRPETELLIDKAAAVIEREGIESMVEIGIGSGAISIVLARKFPKLKIVATDISSDALSIARRNIDRYGVGGQITLRRCNLMDEAGSDPQMVVSNPPYIAEDFLLESNVVDYEPSEALFGGKKGDELLKKIIDDTHSRGIAWLACEMGYDQKSAIQEYINEIGVEYIEFYKDLAGLDRGFVVNFA